VARKERQEYSGAIFHIWTRRVERSLLFTDDDDYATYVGLLGSASSERSWLVLEFCLMPNHVHLLLRISSPNLSAGLRDLHRTYVRRFNDRHGRSGRLFEHRPDWKPVEDEIYFLTVVQYIAQNPVRAGLCARPEEWRWSRRGLLAQRPGPHWLASDKRDPRT
jgi:REP element-mobilizing transposase RayT